VKYASRAAVYYRKKNQALATNTAYNEPELSYEDGRVPVDGNPALQPRVKTQGGELLVANPDAQINNNQEETKEQADQ